MPALLAPRAAPCLQVTSEAEFVEAAGSLSAGLYDFGLVMGTSAATSLSALLEPAFVAQAGGGRGTQLLSVAAAHAAVLCAGCAMR